MIRSAALAAAALAVMLAGCLAGRDAAQPKPGDLCGDEPSPEVARCHAGTVGGSDELVAELRAGRAAAYLFTASEPEFSGEAVEVLFKANGSVQSGRSSALLAENVPATVARTGAGSSGVNEVVTIDPGYLLGVARDDRIAELEVEWRGLSDDPSDVADGSWSTPVTEGPFLVALPDDVPLHARLTFRFTDRRGDVIHETTEP